MRKASYLGLSFFILAFFSILPSVANTQMNISSFGRLTYPAPASSGEIKILRQCFQNGGWSASKFASITDVYQSHYDALSKAQEIEAIRSDVLTFVYYNTRLVWGPGYPPEYDAAKLQMFMDNDWLLKDATGAYVMNKAGTGYIPDIGNADYHTWLANWYKSYIDSYGLDGASLDNWIPTTMAWYVAATTPINPRTGGAWTNQEICDGFRGMTLKIRQVLGSSKIILVNGAYNGHQFWDYGAVKYWQDAILNGGIDAFMSEAWMCPYDASTPYNEEMWEDSILLATWLEENFPSVGGKYLMTICTDNSFISESPAPSFPSDMTEEQYQQFSTFCYASRLLTVNKLISMMSFCYYIEYDYPQSLFKIDIGTPSGDYYKIGSLYARQFIKGLVIVNPTDSSYQANLNGAFKNAVNGSSVSSTLTVQSHTGIILLKV